MYHVLINFNVILILFDIFWFFLDVFEPEKTRLGIWRRSVQFSAYELRSETMSCNMWWCQYQINRRSSWSSGICALLLRSWQWLFDRVSKCIKSNTFFRLYQIYVMSIHFKKRLMCVDMFDKTSRVFIETIRHATQCGTYPSNLQPVNSVLSPCLEKKDQLRWPWRWKSCRWLSLACTLLQL